MRSRIEAALTRAGLPEIPADPAAPLADYGFDSLMIVLTVIEIDKEFNLRVPGAAGTEENFENLISIEKLLKSLGAK